MHATNSKTWTGTILTLGVLLSSLPWFTSPLAGQPKQQGPVNIVVPKAHNDKAEAELHRLRELIRRQPGEFATNIARIAWERDPWEAAVKAAKGGKPVIAYGLQNAGVTCGFG